MYDPRLLDALESLSVAPWSGVVWRATIGETAPMAPNTRGARWNPKGTDALYCSLTEHGARAEISYHLDRQPVPIKRPIRLHRVDVRLSRIVDLTSAGAVEATGFTQHDLCQLDVSIPSQLGGAVAWLGVPGLLVQSVRADATNLVVFPNRFGSDDVVRLIESLDDD